MMSPQISFGDNVRVRPTPETEQAGLAGEVGQVYGQTTPSVTGIEPIGRLTSDYAINVHFARRNEAYWLAPDLLEFVDHAAGTDMRLDGVPKKWTRAADGSWVEERIEEGASTPKAWWRFW